jgi:predicted metalloprotease with PDZ domain
MTYYSRGAVLGAVLDAYLIQKSNKKRSLDGFMQLLYNKYALELKRGFTEVEFEQELSNYCGEDMRTFFNNYVNGTQIIPYSIYFEPMGLYVKDITSAQTSIGATFEGNELVKVKSVRRGSAAEDAGLSVGDEVLICDGYRVDKGMLEGMLNSLSAGESMQLTVARDEKVFQVKFIMKTYTKPQFTIQIKDANAPFLNYWLR